jgi:ribosomal-protein-alanine N-acetyltransferase
MIRRDMAEVLNIENHSFEFCWNEEDFLSALQTRNCIGMVAEYEEQVVGFMLYELHKTHLHILNFAVHEDYRRLRVGSQLVMKLINKLSQQRRSRLELQIRDSNLEAHLFFKSMGFVATNVLHSFYDDSPEDAYTMEYFHKPLKSEFLPVNRFKKKRKIKNNAD